VAKKDRFRAPALLVVLLMTCLTAWTQQTPAPDSEQPAAAPAAQVAGQQPLDLQEQIAHDVLEPLQAGIQTRNPTQVLSVFDADSFPDFAQFRDRLRAFLDTNAVLQFRYKILQAESEGDKAAITCEADVDATPLDQGQTPVRRSTQLRLELQQTAKGWQISSLSPGNFFSR